MEQMVQKEWLDYADAEHYCGLSRITLWRRVKSGDLPAYRVGRSVRFRRTDLDALFEERAPGEMPVMPGAARTL